jgi:serine/threonine protein kinase
MRDGERCRFSVSADDETKTVDRNVEARTIERNVEVQTIERNARTIERNVEAQTIERKQEAKTLERDVEQGGPPGRTLVRPPSAALLVNERQPKTRSDLLASTEPDAELTDDPLGTLIDDRYFVEALIARGGMGVVYRCRHKSIGKQVAVKVLRKDLARLAAAPRRLLIEAQAASAIGNEHIIDITDFGTLPNGSSYLVMELLDGLPLAELITSQGTLPLPRVLAIGKQIAEGLMAAHAAGIVHRDLKPENIFLLRRKSDDFVKILDFGIAKIAPADSAPLTGAGMIIGTPDYMSPEQAAGAEIDHRVDIYSLGVILYQLAAGRVPFYAGNYLGLLTKIMTEPPPPFRALIPRPPVPPEFEGIVLKCLEKQPRSRFQSMQELLLALEGVEQLSNAPAGADSSEAGLRRSAPREHAPSVEPRSPGSLSAVSGQGLSRSTGSARWGIQAVAVVLVLLFSLTWLSYLQRAQLPALASAAAGEALPLPLAAEAPQSELPPEQQPATPSDVAPVVQKLAPPSPSQQASPHPAAARKTHAPRPAAPLSPPRVPERVAVPTPARSLPAGRDADGLLQPWSERP